MTSILWRSTSLLFRRMTVPREHLCRGFKSVYNIETLYPNASNYTDPVQKLKTNENSKQFSGLIPLDELKISYSRSSGPGGQNVNKVNTKVEIRFHVLSAKWLPESVKPKLMEKESGRINKEGYLIVTSDKTRKQILNQADCLYKLRSMIFDCSTTVPEPTKEELDILRERQERARAGMLREKRTNSLKKESRRAPTSSDI